MWRTAPLGDVCEVKRGTTITKKQTIVGNVPVIGGGTKPTYYHNEHNRESGVVTVSGSGANAGYVNYWDRPIYASDCSTVEPASKDQDRRFIYYYMCSKQNYIYETFRTGAAQPHVYAKDVATLEYPLVPITEQKRIGAILDEAFKGIDAAVANAQLNLANAGELFESYLDKVSGPKKPLGDFVTIKTGKLNANAAVEGGQYPFFTCSREVYGIDHYAFDCEAILLAGNNASGDFNVKHYSGKFNAYQRTYVIQINNESEVRYRFLYFQMLKSLKELKNSSIGVGTKYLKLGMIKDLLIAAPEVEEQDQILNFLDHLQLQSERLEAIYQQKLNALAELKQSILAKAFSGELTLREAA